LWELQYPKPSENCWDFLLNFINGEKLSVIQLNLYGTYITNRVYFAQQCWRTTHCKSVPAQSQIWHTMCQSCLKWRTTSHMWSIFCFTYMCQICLTIFLTHGVPNTPQVKPIEDNCEAYFTQHVSNVTWCRCQIYSAVLVFVVLNEIKLFDTCSVLKKMHCISFYCHVK
jgi:hypothetical protein